MTTTATAVMAYAAYQLQADEAVGRFAGSAVATSAADRQVVEEFSQVGSAGWLDELPTRLGADPDWAMVRKDPGRPLEIVRATPESGASDVPPIPGPDKLTLLRAVESKLLEPELGPGRASTIYANVPLTGRKVFVVNENLAYPGYHLVQFHDFSRYDGDLSALRWSLVRTALLVSVLGVGAALLIARRIRRPILRVSSAAKDLGAGALDVRVPVKGHDEVADLAKSFNAMAHRLGESIEELRAKDRQQQRFVADVAHDLRTPLASMVAVVDTLDDAAPATRTRAGEILGTQARRLARLVEDLLEIARFDAGEADLRTETAGLRDLVEDAADVSGVDVTVTGDATVVADPRRVHTIVANLLTNAVRHGAAPVTVLLTGSESEVVLRVHDSGPGVPADLLPILFDRFTRGDRARRATDGSGLGLAIASGNARAHGGTLTAHNEGGAVFTLTLPRNAAQAENNDTTPGPLSSRGA
ncbi:sensor histidine kinase [Amycolatopsis sp. NPDC088138]|uniref:sensor histidine kinase n=1 Tax=Amycolatopsis sp. NPDC088138 TaxID=3363938 RepID=UPI00382A69E7